MDMELGVRYRAGREGAVVIWRDGSSTQLQPFEYIRFFRQNPPHKVTGELVRIAPRRIRLETKA